MIIWVRLAAASAKYQPHSIAGIIYQLISPTAPTIFKVNDTANAIATRYRGRNDI
jgi:hypothetical protein